MVLLCFKASRGEPPSLLHRLQAAPTLPWTFLPEQCLEGGERGGGNGSNHTGMVLVEVGGGLGGGGGGGGYFVFPVSQ